MVKPTSYKNLERERGSALVYILIAIALLAALTMSFMQPSSQQTTSQNAFRTTADMKSQINIVRAAIQECVLRYSIGDTSINNGSTTDAAHNIPYPIKPNSTHYTGATTGPTAGRLVRDIRCPGNNPGDPNDPTDATSKNHEKLFAGSGGKFMPEPPDLFEDWQYYNAADGVYFWTSTDKTDAFLLTALEKLDDGFSECETDIIDATGSAVDLDSAGSAETQCDSGHTCFRVWVIANGSADHQDAGCP